MNQKKRFHTSQLLFASPWILAAAIGILLAIVVFFSINNLQREKKIMIASLFNKAQAVVRFVAATTRASMMTGAHNPIQVQHLIEQAAGGSSILYIAVVDGEGRILAHSDPGRVGTIMKHPLLAGQPLPPMGSYRIRSTDTSRASRSGEVFELVSPFRPFASGRGRFFRQRLQQMQQRMGDGCPPPPGKNGQGATSPAWCQSWLGPTSEGKAGSRFIVVGLDMSEEARVIRQDRYHMLYMSLAMLLVGVGGWIALLVTQGYKTSQKTLEQVQAFTSLLISRLPLGIIATNQEGRIQTFNTAAATMTGLTRAGAIGQEPTAVLPASLAGLFNEQAGQEDGLERELVFERPDGSRLNLHASVVAITDSAGTTIGRVLLLHDLTERKALEQEIRKQEHLVSLGKMAAGVAHEVRNPLSSIKGLATLLGSRFSRQSREHQAADLLVSEVERLNRSITELLNYARPLPLNRQEISLATLLDQSLQLIRGDAEQLGVEVTVEMEDLPRIKADPDRLNQVLLNLYLNSLQAMADGGRLAVRARADRRRQRLEIEVEDTGCGIKPETLARVMDPYFTTKPDGTGLGLAMVHKIIDEHQGSIDIRSQPGQGTTVTISLPL